MKLSFLYLCGREQSSSFYFFKLKSSGYCTSSTLMDNGIPYQKMQLNLFISSTEAPGVLLIWQLTLLLPAGFLVLRKTAVKDHTGTADSPLQFSCIGPDLLLLCPVEMAANWTMEDIRGHFHTHAKWTHHRRVINNYSKIQLILTGYKLMSILCKMAC